MTYENPFPGMDPWLELRWSDVHTRLLSNITEDLGKALPDGLIARAEEGILLSEDTTALAPMLLWPNWTVGNPVSLPNGNPNLVQHRRNQCVFC